MEQMTRANTGIKPASLEELRHRLYKAVRATLLESPEPKARFARLTQWVQEMVAEGPRAVTFPEELSEAQSKALQAGWQRAVNRARHLAGKNFAWQTADFDLAQELTGAVAEVVRNDLLALAWEKGALQKQPPINAALRSALLRHCMRRSWCGDATQPESFRMTGWLEEVAFLPRRLTEIGTWARFFHTIAEIHRKGQKAPEARKQALDQLLARVGQGGSLSFIPEVVLYLDEEINCQEKGETFPGPLPPPLEPDVFFRGPDQNLTLRLIREALEFLRARGQKPEMQKRLDWLREHREFLDLRDLMYIFLKSLQESEAPQDTGQVLNHLQHLGFPILYQDFRDEYRTWLAPLPEAVQAGETALRLPLDPASLSGDADIDLDSQEQRETGRRQALQSFRQAALAFIEGKNHPLPKSELVRPAAAFAVTWIAAEKLAQGEPSDLAGLAEEAARLLPPPLLRLIRPRKGYELKHKSELQRFIEAEAEMFTEALASWRHAGRIASLHDDRLLFRLACARALQKKVAGLGGLTEEAVLRLKMADISVFLEELTKRLKVDPAPAGAPWWCEFQGWLKEKLKWPEVLAAGREWGDDELLWCQAAENMFQDLVRQAYRLAVAFSRRHRGLPPLTGERALVPWLAAWLTPLCSSLKEQVNRQLLHTLRDRARQSLWETYPLRVESREELDSLIKYFLARELMGRDLETCSRTLPLSQLMDTVSQKLSRVEIPPEIMPPGGLAAAIQEVLRPRAPEDASELRRLEEAVLALLPRSDCGSCGAPGCLAFARLLVRGQAVPGQCLQGSESVKHQLEELLAQSPAAASEAEPYLLTEEDCERLGPLLDAYAMALRDRVARELSGPQAQKLFPLKLDEVSILQVAKSPDAADFHHYLEDFLGPEAAQALSNRDRAWLVQYGENRLAAEVKALEERFSWLSQETRSGLSVYALTPLDPVYQARQAYASCFFLSDLSAGDQELIRELRLRQYLEEFRAEWERALPEHWRAGYRIEDWDDFAHLMAKSYWHQERTPAVGRVIRSLPREVLHSRETEELAGSFLEKLVRQEVNSLEYCRQRLENLLQHRALTSLGDLKILVQGLAVQSFQKAEKAEPGLDRSEETLINRRVGHVFRVLNQANLRISGDLRIFGEELPFRVRELLAENPHLPASEVTRLETAREGLSWRELHAWQADLLKALTQAAVEQLFRESQEVERLRRGNVPLVTGRLLRQTVRHLFWSGHRRIPDLLESLEALLTQCPDGRKWLLHLALQDYLWQLLDRGDFLKTEAGASPLTKILNQSLRAQYAHDVQKLKAYMYLLARLEGDLDRLTALLREIRETSDIIEATWLAFTEEQAALATIPVSAPGGPIPLLASALEDRERFNRYLYEGLPRGEPREYRQAYWELITILQFYVVTAAPGETPEDMFRRFEADRYDLDGLSPEAMRHALAHQAQHRERLLPRKINICTEVLAHRLAKTDPRLAQTVAAFLQQKGDLLKEEGLAAELAKARIAAARGVELARIRNELYTQIADLLTEERTESFARRIGQIIDRLEEERRDTLAALRRGELNRLTAFYIFRQYQKDVERVPPADLHRFLRRYQPEILEELRTRLAPQVRAAVDQELDRITASYRAALEG